MLNPDGVICGNYRCSLAAVDLNRRWARPSAKLHPTIHALKKLLLRLHVRQPVALFCDLHGHSRKQRVFMYGCDETCTAANQNGCYNSSCCSSGGMMNTAARGPRVPALLQSVFPLLCSRNSTTTRRESGGNGADNFFSFGSCNYMIKKSKESTGRVVVHRELSLVTSYTMEASFCGCDDRRRNRNAQLDSDDDNEEAPAPAPAPAAADGEKPRGTGFHFSTAHLQQIGCRFCRALHAYFGLLGPAAVTDEKKLREDEAALAAIEGIGALPSNQSIHQCLLDLMSGEFDEGADGDTEGSDGGEGSDNEDKNAPAAEPPKASAPAANPPAADGKQLRVAAPPPPKKEEPKLNRRNSISTRRTREQEMRAAAQRAEAAAAAAAALLGNRPDLLGGASLPPPRPIVGLAAHHYAARDHYREERAQPAGFQQQPQLSNPHSIGFQQQPMAQHQLQQQQQQQQLQQHLQHHPGFQQQTTAVQPLQQPPQQPPPPQQQPAGASGFQQQPSSVAGMPPHMQYASTFQQQPQALAAQQLQLLQQQRQHQQQQQQTAQQSLQAAQQLQQQQLQQQQLQQQSPSVRAAADRASITSGGGCSASATDTEGYEPDGTDYEGDGGENAVSRGASYERGRGFTGKSLSMRSQPAATQWAMRGNRPGQPGGAPSLLGGSNTATPPAMQAPGGGLPPRSSSGGPPSESRRPVGGAPAVAAPPGQSPTGPPPATPGSLGPGGAGALLKRRAQVPSSIDSAYASQAAGGAPLPDDGGANGASSASRSTPFAELIARRGGDGGSHPGTAGGAMGSGGMVAPACMQDGAPLEPGLVAGLELLVSHVRRHGERGGSAGEGEGEGVVPMYAAAAHAGSGIGHARSKSSPVAGRRAHPPSTQAAPPLLAGGYDDLSSAAHTDADVSASEVDDAIYSFAASLRASRRALSNANADGGDDELLCYAQPGSCASDETAVAELHHHGCGGHGCGGHGCYGGLGLGGSLSHGGSHGGSLGGSGRPGSGGVHARSGSVAAGVLVGNAPAACGPPFGSGAPPFANGSGDVRSGRRYADRPSGLAQTLPMKPPAAGVLVGGGVDGSNGTSLIPGAGAPSMAASLSGNGSWPRSWNSRPRTGEASVGSRPLDPRTNAVPTRRTAYYEQAPQGKDPRHAMQNGGRG